MGCLSMEIKKISFLGDWSLPKKCSRLFRLKTQSRLHSFCHVSIRFNLEWITLAAPLPIVRVIHHQSKIITITSFNCQWKSTLQEFIENKSGRNKVVKLDLSYNKNNFIITLQKKLSLNHPNKLSTKSLKVAMACWSELWWGQKMVEDPFFRKNYTQLNLKLMVKLQKSYKANFN